MEGALEHQGAPRPDQGPGGRESCGVPGGFDDHVSPGRDLIPSEPDADAAPLQDGQLVRVPAHSQEIAAGQPQHLSHQQPQLAVAQHDYPIGGPDGHLLYDLTGGGHRLGEHRPLVGDRRGDRVQKMKRQGEIIGHGAVTPVEAQRGAVRAVGGVAPATGRTHAAIGIDLAHHPPAD